MCFNCFLEALLSVRKHRFARLGSRFFPLEAACSMHDALELFVIEYCRGTSKTQYTQCQPGALYRSTVCFSWLGTWLFHLVSWKTPGASGAPLSSGRNRKPCSRSRAGWLRDEELSEAHLEAILQAGRDQDPGRRADALPPRRMRCVGSSEGYPENEKLCVV